MRSQTIPFLKSLRENIIEAFQSLEPEVSFERKPWDYQSGSGGGEMGVIRNGCAFEKAAVNISEVSGDTFPGTDGTGPFFAAGISLITHMRNPHAPTVHFNIRYIETPDESWLGGGYDLTPMGYPYEEDTDHFHRIAKESLDEINPELYPKFYQDAKEYFYIRHRKKERGVGGIFFDHYHTDDREEDILMWKTVGNSFLPAIMPIYQKRGDLPYSQSEKEVQWKLRGHYAEFNLVYDRGTRFGFLSGGNPEAILCSMPPVATW